MVDQYVFAQAQQYVLTDQYIIAGEQQYVLINQYAIPVPPAVEYMGGSLPEQALYTQGLGNMVTTGRNCRVNMSMVQTIDLNI